MERVVRHLGAEAESVHSGEEALALLARRAEAPPALVLLDVRLAGIDGWKTLEAINRLADGSRPPVVMLTASQDEALRERALRMGGRLLGQVGVRLQRLRSDARAVCRAAAGRVGGARARERAALTRR